MQTLCTRCCEGVRVAVGGAAEGGKRRTARLLLRIHDDERTPVIFGERSELQQATRGGEDTKETLRIFL